MDVSRRGFLTGFGAALAAGKTYFFAPVGGWHSDLIVNPNHVVSETVVNTNGRVAYNGRYHTWWHDPNESDPREAWALTVPKRRDVSRKLTTLPDHIFGRLDAGQIALRDKLTAQGIESRREATERLRRQFEAVIVLTDSLKF